MREDNTYWNRQVIGRFDNRVSRRRLLHGAAITGGGLAGAVLIGCGDEESGDDGNGGGGQPSGDGTPEGQGATSDGEPQRGGILTTNVPGDAPNFDMHANSTYLMQHLGALVYNQLVQFDPLNPDEPPDAVVADLAESWEESSDGLSMTFTTVGNAKYQNGQTFTSADVKATLERIQDPPEGVVSPRSVQFEPVESIETPDDQTVVFHMSRPFPSLLPLLAQSWNSIYSAEDINGGFDFELELNGTGPYRFQEYQRGNRFVAVRNDEYHVEGRPYLDGVTIYTIPDASTALANFQSGELLVLYAPNVTNSESLRESMGDQITIPSVPYYSFHSINFGQRDPWRDDRVRRAISMSLDREAGISLLDEGEGYLGGYHVSSGVWAISEEQLREVPGYEPLTEETLTEARQLLDAAGVEEGHEATLLTRQLDSYEKLSLFIQEQIAPLGLNGTVQVLETAAAYDALNTRNFDIAPWNHAYAVDDPDAVFAEFYTTDAPRNYTEVGSAEVDDLFQQQSQELDFESRKELVNQMEIEALQLYGKIITGWRSIREGRWNTVKNRVRHSSNYNNQRWEDVWLDV